MKPQRVGIAPRTHATLEGRGIVLLAAVVALVETVAVARPGAPESILALVRLTAQTSVVWFALAFAARPLVALRPRPASKWLLRNRRYLGLGMAVSHGTHLLAIAALAASQGPALWNRLATTTLVGGTLGYVVLAAMAATSFDRSQAWLGRRRWRLLHGTGMWLFWTIFTLTYVGQLGRSSLAVLVTAVMVGLLGLRVAARLRRTEHRR